MKRLHVVYILIVAIFLVYAIFMYYEGASSEIRVQEGLSGEIDETYVMVTFQAGIEYWKSVLKGFEDAASKLNVSVEYRGSTQYDVQEQITVLEQVIAKKPAGIALTAIDPDALTPSINKAVDAGIPVVLFDSGASGSKAYSFLATDNYNAGVTAAHKMAELVNGRGKVGVVTLPNQLNHQQRTAGFKDTIAAHYPQMEVVAVRDGKGDQIVSREAALAIMREHPDVAGLFNTDAVGGVGVGEAVWLERKTGQVRVIGFDTDKGTLDMIKDGLISATLAQGTWNMGYWSLQFLFHLHHGIVSPAAGNRTGVSPLPVQVDTGVTVVTLENVDDYYAK